MGTHHEDVVAPHSGWGALELPKKERHHLGSQRRVMHLRKGRDFAVSRRCPTNMREAEHTADMARWSNRKLAERENDVSLQLLLTIIDRLRRDTDRPRGRRGEQRLRSSRTHLSEIWL